MVFDELKVEVFKSRDEMGKKASDDVKRSIKDLLEKQEEVNMVFAAAPSQNDFFDYLTEEKDVEWNRVNAFHMDEYIGLEKTHPSAFSNFLQDKVFKHLPLKSAHFIDGLSDPNQECRRYAELLIENPVDIVIMGIGENGHIAFNDPDVADFNDPEDVKIVVLDEMSRKQQVNDGCFNNIDEVPTHAITLTIPRLLNAKYVYCIVPTERKAQAVKDALYNPISVQCPASILRTKSGSILYLDQDAAMYLEEKDEEN
ncbi:glucosamine-6-phosphate deaminase [Proteiniclasticum sp. SCR006]|uniref:Glucosamine-6-phosphate deaminase n=1 Tax=Proteiniclasticum aestuarii TaxID=2817862 RepID=A0A939HDP9_9CLOT|nr:glucosamine-6-phosphate deaminase [Proteiniclasticum aestuarii]MBO1266092.1 glucosamine-6-phosphate deaminase [Proteiniclasticum aestuarii]